MPRFMDEDADRMYKEFEVLQDKISDLLADFERLKRTYCDDVRRKNAERIREDSVLRGVTIIIGKGE